MKADNEAEADSEVLTIFGIYFCSRCRNMMAPSLSLGSQLVFKCQSCGIRKVEF